MSENTNKLKVCSFGFALGLWWGIGMLLVSWFSWWCGGWGGAFITSMSSLYIGYAPTFVGGILGFIWGFIDFFIFGVLIAWTYNCCSKGCCKKSCGTDKKE